MLRPKYYPPWGPTGFALPLFCPHCGAEYPDYLDTVENLILFGDDAHGTRPAVIRKCLDCRAWEYPDSAIEMLEMICRGDPNVG